MIVLRQIQHKKEMAALELEEAELIEQMKSLGMPLMSEESTDAPAWISAAELIKKTESDGMPLMSEDSADAPPQTKPENKSKGKVGREERALKPLSTGNSVVEPSQ